MNKLFSAISSAFSNTKSIKSNHSSSNQKLRSEYNVMFDIKVQKLKKHENPKNYELIEEGIYVDLTDKEESNYRIAISYKLKSDETNNLYPLEDILDRYLLYVADFLESENKKNSDQFSLELGGDFEAVTSLKKEVIGKNVFNREFVDKDGQIRVNLISE